MADPAISSMNRSAVAEPTETIGNVRQLSLPTLDARPRDSTRSGERRSKSTRRIVDQDPLAVTYFRRLGAQGVARAGFHSYRYQLESVLRIASRLRGESVSLQSLFRDTELLGQVLTDDEAPVQGGRLSKWTLAQRRSAIRSFGSLMRPELRDIVQHEPLERIDAALRSTAERIGAGYRLTGGKPRQRGGYVPEPFEIAAVIKAAGQAPGYHGIRNQVFLQILVTTGTRVNALRELDGSDCFELPSGRLRLFVHDKGKFEAREIELSLELSSRLQRYVDAFNQFAAGRRWRARIRLGEPGPVWRNSGRGRWPYDAVLGSLHQACTEVGITPFSPHALRRAFATDATSMLPRHVVALAGGWQGLDRLDDHYVHPRQQEIWKKLAGITLGEARHYVNERTRNVPVVAL